MMKKIAFSIVFVLFVYSALATLGAMFARNEVKNIDISTLTQSTNNFEEFFKKTDRIRRNIFLARPFLNLNHFWGNKINTLDKIAQNKPLAQEILGIKDEKTFLVVMQNNTELRPSGGIWGSYGILKVRDGKITSLKTDDTFFLDEINKGRFSPPQEVSDVFEDEWRFWNANWSPDFKKSVEQGLFFYKQADSSIDFDGVLGPNVDFLLSLLDVSGPIGIADHSFKLDSENFIQKMIYEPTNPAVIETTKNYKGVVSSKEKNIVLASIGKNIIDQITLQKKESSLAQKTFEALTNQNLLIYLKNDDLQIQAEKMGFAGRTPQGGNFVMIVDANLGSKLDFIVSKSATIKKLEEGKYQATVSYKNNLDPSDSSQFFKNYRNLVRIFVPRGSTLVEQTGGQKMNDLTNDDNTGQSYISSLLILEPGEEGQYSFTWKVDNSIANQELTIIKQPGNHMSFS